MKPALRVLQGSFRFRRSAIDAAFDHFRLERQGNLVSRHTLTHYDSLVLPFLRWLEVRYPQLVGFEDLDVAILREYRAELAARPSRWGRPLAASTLQDSHRLLLAFFRWAELEGYEVDRRILRLPSPKVPLKEATVFHIAQLRQILAACSAELPQEELAVRILVGSGVRASELCGLSLRASDGLSDLMLDSLVRGRVELRVRWDAGAKGSKSRRVPITPKLASAIKRFEARAPRREDVEAILVNERGERFAQWGIDSMMDRLRARVGFRVHAHAFRHTFATVTTKMGWNFEHLRAAMGHADYAMLQRYVRLAAERDLGPLKEWADFIVPKPVVE